MIFVEQHVTKMVELPCSWFEKIKWRGGRYKIIIYPTYPWPGEVPAIMSQWIKENIRAKIGSTLFHDAYNIYFKSKDEALAFKLRWFK